jgi:hypothetical protein
MTIDIHEWPLPANELEAKAAVFEINVPEVIWVWRETTYEMLVDVFTPYFETPKAPIDKYTLHGFSGLKKWIESSAGRLQMASPQVSGQCPLNSRTLRCRPFLIFQVTSEKFHAHFSLVP